MGKIISGGLITSAPKSQSNYIEDNAPEEQESWGGYALRNVTKVPALAYELGRSGLGVGNIAETVARKAGAPQAIKTGLRYLLPTTQQAHEEISSVLPTYATEHRPGDYPAEFALTELPLILASGGARSLPAFGKSALTSLGILGGSQVGRAAGGAIGKALGDEEIGELIGGLGGGHLGAVASRGGLRRPSKILPSKVKAVEESIFQNRINTVKNDISGYKDKIKNLDESRKIAYENASKLEGKTRGNAANILETINEVKDDIYKGVSKSDRKLIRQNIASLERGIKTGELSLSDAKKFQKNFNDQIYNYGASISQKRQLTKLTGSLNDFIKKTGGEEHNINWQQGEQATRELKNLKRGERDYIKEKNSEIREMTKEKNSFENKTSKILDKVLSAANKYGVAGLGAFVGSYFGYGKVGAIAGKILGEGAREFNIAKEVFNTHPEIFKEYTKLIKDAASTTSKSDIARILTKVNDLGSQIEALAQEEKYKSNKKIISGGLKY